MSANNSPIFTLTPNNGISNSSILTIANTTRDLSSATGAIAFLSAGTNGSRVDQIDFTHVSSASTTASIAAVGRIWKCTSSVGANPVLVKEVALPLVTPSLTAIGGAVTITFSTPLVIENGLWLLATLSVSQATNSGYAAHP